MSDETVTPPGPARRTFLGRLALLLTSVAGAAVTVPVVGFVLGPLLRHPPDVWRDVGPLDRFRVGDTVEVAFQQPASTPSAGVAAMAGAWVRRESAGGFVAFSLHCTHLGCPIRWIDDAELFMCPCHGGVYYRDGRVAAGPPLEPLKHLAVRVREGRVEIRTRPIPIT